MKFKAVNLMLLGLLSLNLSAKQVPLDQVAAIVDQGVVLESEIKTLISTVKRNAETNNQTLPSDKVLRIQAIERLIQTSLQMQLAQRMGIQISDPQLEQTITNMTSRDGTTPEQLRFKLAEEGIAYDSYRENIRRELITGEVMRSNVRRRVYITPQEIDNLLKLIEQQGEDQVEYHLGHILVDFPQQPTDEDIDASRVRANRVLKLLKDGSDFAKMAITSSSGSKALEGGDMGWMNINAMPTLFAEAVQGKEKGTIVGPIRSGAGFHILKLKDIRGQQKVEINEVKARHILVKPSIILSEDKTKSMLIEFRNKVLAGEAEFADLAKEHSEDPGSALKGGELGWADPNIYAPAFKNTLATLEPLQISEPFRSSFGWHIVQLQEKRVQDGTNKLKQDKAYQLLFNRKFAEEQEAWLRELRDGAYIEVIEEQ